MPSKEELAELWLHAQPGRLSAKEKLRAMALHDAMKDLKDGQVNLQCIANKLTVGSGGRPSREALRWLLLRIDSDSERYPGKSYQTQHCPAPLLARAKRRAIATSIMAAKKRGHEPSTAVAVHFCPAATLNPVASAPFMPKYIRQVVTEVCYDVTPDNSLQLQRCLQKTWLPPALQAQRLAWAKQELAKARPHV